MHVLALSGKLPIEMIVPPHTMLLAVFVATFRSKRTILMVGKKQAMSNPAGAVRRCVARVVEADDA